MKATTISTVFFIIFNWQTIQAALINPTLLPVVNSIIGTQYPDPWTNVRVYFYYGEGNLQNTSYQLKDANQLLSHPVFDINKITTFYVHGYNENQNRESIQAMRNAYSYQPNHNLVCLDYSIYVAETIITDYVKAFQVVPYLAPYVGEALLNLFTSGLPLSSFHLVGHSLGGQLSGYIGREIIEQSSGSLILPRISALDPAFPGYYVLPIVIDQLGPTDAVFVDVIHTDAGIYGAPFPTGTVDFWPNGGHGVQPGCPVPRPLLVGGDDDFCSHHRSWRFWAESVANLYLEKFIAEEADSYLDYKLGLCEGQTEVMGLYVSLDASGNYYLDTNASPPYAQG